MTVYHSGKTVPVTNSVTYTVMPVGCQSSGDPTNPCGTVPATAGLWPDYGAHQRDRADDGCGSSVHLDRSSFRHPPRAADAAAI